MGLDNFVIIIGGMLSKLTRSVLLLFIVASSFLGAGVANASPNASDQQIEEQGKKDPVLLFEPHCFASASLNQGSSTVIASGYGRCTLMPPITLGVTVIMYHNGWNIGSTYKSCYMATDEDCHGYPISTPNSGGNYCSRVMIDYVEPNTGDFKQSSISNGVGC